MSRRKKAPPRPPRTGGADPEGFLQLSREWVKWMETRNYSRLTIDRVDRTVMIFGDWCEEHGVHRPSEVTRPVLEAYARHLYHRRTAAGAALSFRAQYNELSALRVFFRFLARTNHILVSPASDLELPKLAQTVPRTLLTHEEVERVLAQPDLATPAGMRDRALLETLYSTGMRRMEVTRLSVFDLDRARGTLLIREGKGKKDRVVPVGARALEWIDRYLEDVRPSQVIDAQEHTLFLTAYGLPLSDSGLTHRIREYVEAAGLGKHGSCHIFRHSMATLMLERGADVRVLQAILGHSKLNTTQLYTHVSIGHLKRVHEQTHPTGKTPRREAAEEAATPPAASRPAAAEQATTPPPAQKSPAARASRKRSGRSSTKPRRK